MTLAGDGEYYTLNMCRKRTFGKGKSRWKENKKTVYLRVD
jgi:hypothetical protein